MPLVKRCRRKCDGDVERCHRQHHGGKARPNGAPGCGKAVAFREDIADDVGDGEEEERAVGNQWPQGHAFGGRDVGDDENDNKQRKKYGIVAAVYWN